jgi:hypothetical protein
MGAHLVSLEAVAALAILIVLTFGAKRIRRVVVTTFRSLRKDQEKRS